MLAIYFGDSQNCSPDSSPDTPKQRGLSHDHAWMVASSAQLASGLPGTLNRGDSRLQVDLAGIQNRLKQIAKLRDTAPSSPRGERISPWLSLSTTGSPSATGELGRLGTLGKPSPVRMSPLKASSAQRPSDAARPRSALQSPAGLLAAADAASGPSSAACLQNADLDPSNQLPAVASADAVSLDHSDQ